MLPRTINPPTNRLLATLRYDDTRRILSRGETVDLVFDEVLCEHNQKPRYVYFPLTGIISLIIAVGDGAGLELTMIGNEGMLGATNILGISEAPLRGIVQTNGTAIRIRADEFQELSRKSTQLQAVVKRYLFVLMTQLNRTAGCTHFHAVSARLARWLLMAHDRTPGEGFYLTQQSLSEMLGVQRSAVSIAAGLLQNRKLISYSRGDIKILNRRALEAASCPCYAALKEDQRRFYLD